VVDVGGPDVAVGDAHGLDSPVANPDAASIDAASADAASADATFDAGAGPTPCPTIYLGGLDCDRGCPAARLSHSSGYTASERLGYWICGRPTWIQPAALTGDVGGASLRVTPTAAATPTDRQPMVGGGYVAR